MNRDLKPENVAVVVGSDNDHYRPQAENAAENASFQLAKTEVAVGAELVATTPALPRDRDPRLVYLSSLSTAKSRRSMAGALERFAAAFRLSAVLLPWHHLRFQHTNAARAVLVSRFAPATVNQALAAVRGVLRMASRLELMTAEHALRASDLRPARGKRLPRGRALATREIIELLDDAAKHSVAGTRDAAMLSVLYGCGLRRTELVDVDLHDYDPRAVTLLVHGKGGKDRVAHLGNAAPALDRWLADRGFEQGPLFGHVDRKGRIVIRRLSDRSVAKILRRLSVRSGIAKFSPHDLRRTFVSELLDEGVDIKTVADLVGHSQVTTTAKYDRRGDDAKRAAAKKLRGLL